MTFIQVNDGKAKSCAKSRVLKVLNIKTPMAAILPGDNHPTTKNLGRSKMTYILVKDRKAKGCAKPRVVCTERRNTDDSNFIRG